MAYDNRWHRRDNSRKCNGINELALKVAGTHDKSCQRSGILFNKNDQFVVLCRLALAVQRFASEVVPGIGDRAKSNRLEGCTMTSWRVITLAGNVLSAHGKTGAITVAETQSYLWLMDRINKTVIVLPEPKRAEVLAQLDVIISGGIVTNVQ